MVKGSLTTDQKKLITKDMMDYAEAISRKYWYCGIPLEDLRQEAHLGLCLAAMKYDEGEGATFKTFATYYVVRELENAVKSYSGPVKLPRQVKRRAISQSLDAAGLEDNKKQGKEKNRLDDESSVAFRDNERYSEQEEAVEQLLGNLTSTERKSIELIFGIKHVAYDMNEVAREMGVTPQHLSRIKKKALMKMGMVA